MSNETIQPPHTATPSNSLGDICLEAHALVTGDRNHHYDHPYNDYSKVRDIYQAITGINLTVEEAVMFPLAMKLARIRTARDKGRYHHDSVVDAVGYLACFAAVVEVGAPTVNV